jgi:hypothetical protein
MKPISYRQKSDVPEKFTIGKSNGNQQLILIATHTPEIRRVAEDRENESTTNYFVYIAQGGGREDGRGTAST